MSWQGREYPYICFIHKTLNETIESVSRFGFLTLSLLNIIQYYENSYFIVTIQPFIIICLFI